MLGGGAEIGNPRLRLKRPDDPLNLRQNAVVDPEADLHDIEGFLTRQVAAKNAYEFYGLLRRESETPKLAKKKTKKTTRKKSAKTTTTTAKTAKKTTKKKATKKAARGRKAAKKKVVKAKK